MEQMKKVMAIPTDTTGLGGSKVLNVSKIDAIIVRFQDGKGQEDTKLGFIIGDEIRFIDTKALSKPAQSWLTRGVKEVLTNGKK